MPKQTVPLIALITLLNVIPATNAHANTFKNLSINGITGLDLSSGEKWLNALQIKRGEPYDEKKDPALRKGTENEEMPQGSFFAIPAFIIGIGLVFLFFNRDKE